MNNPRLQQIYQALGITEEHLRQNRLPFQHQPELKDLRIVDIDFEGKPFVLVKSAAKAWREMREAAHLDQIEIYPFSGFRSYMHQKNLIERRLRQGRSLEQIFTQIAIPGFSEHHSGRAVDIHTLARPELHEEFEMTSEFQWLAQNAGRFGFEMSYPRDNSFGIIYEPWHWCYRGPA